MNCSGGYSYGPRDEGSFRTDVYPAQGLAASPEWLRRNPTTAKKITRALREAIEFMRNHSPEEIRSRMPAQYRSPDAGADLQALRETIPRLSRNGKVTPDGATAVKTVLDVSSEKVRAAKIDLATTYTNQFVNRNGTVSDSDGPRCPEPGGCGHDRRQKTVSAVRMAVPLSPITYLPVYLGRELGYYAEQGLDAELKISPADRSSPGDVRRECRCMRMRL